MSTYRVSFEVVKERGEVKAKCNGCGKVFKRVVVAEWTKNPYHNWDETRQAKRKWVSEECARIAEAGITCRKCDEPLWESEQLELKARKG